MCDNHARLESIYLILSQWRTYTPTSDTLLSTLNIEMESAASFEDKCIARCKAIISNQYLAVENAVQAAAHEMAYQEKQLLSNVKYRDSAWCIPKDLKCSSNKIICMPFIENIKRSRLSPKWIKMVWWLVKKHCLKEIRLKSPLRLYHTNGSWQRHCPRDIPSAQGGLEADFLAGSDSPRPHTVLPRSWLGLEGSALPRLGSKLISLLKTASAHGAQVQV